MELTPLEISERLMARVASAARDRLGSGDAVWGALRSALAERMAAAAGVDYRSDDAADDVRASVEAMLDGFEGELGAAVREPHALGWLHQYVGEPERAESHRAHNEREAKHESAGVTTQLYTPRWIADLLANSLLEREDKRLPTVLDPAVGGGQMLLAAYDALRRRAPDASPAEIVGALAGRDIDARAVDVARWNLKIRAARETGSRLEEIEEVIDDRIRPGDALFEPVRGADVVLTNPPYMGARSMPESLKNRIRDRYEPFHRDLYAAFIRRCHELAASRIGILAQQTIWYLKSFRAARQQLLVDGDLEVFVHLGPHAFRSLDGEKANVAAFVQRAFGTDESRSAPATFLDLRDLSDPDAMRDAVGRAIGETGSEHDRRVEREPRVFRSIPGAPLAHWLPTALRKHFDGSRRLGDVADIPGRQNKTGSNAKYVREWSELDESACWQQPFRLEPADAPERLAPSDDARWIPYSKGGGYAPWWGNWESFVDWSPEAREFYRDNSTSNLLPERYRFRQAICYTDFGGQTFNARWMPAGCLFDMAGPAIFPSDEAPRLFALLGVLNTTPVRMLLNAMNPSIHYQVTDLRRLPLPEFSQETERRLSKLALGNVRDVRRLAALREASPVSIDHVDRGVEPREIDEICRRCEERERTIETIAFEIYRLPRGEIDPVRSTHRYFTERSG